MTYHVEACIAHDRDGFDTEWVWVCDTTGPVAGISDFGLLTNGTLYGGRVIDSNGDIVAELLGDGSWEVVVDA